MRAVTRARGARVAGAAVVLLVVAALLWRARGPEAAPPVQLPAVFLDLPRSPGGFDASWSRSVKEAAGDASFAGAQYGSARSSLINVTVARADLTGRLDERLAGDGGQQFGETTCTGTLRLGAGATVAGKALCWRNSPGLSVITLSMVRPPDLATLAAGTDRLYRELH